jgi:hypothetical protein
MGVQILLEILEESTFDPLTICLVLSLCSQELGCLLQVTVSLICFSMVIPEIEQKRSGYGDRFVV